MDSLSFYLFSILLIFTSVKGSEFDYSHQAKWYDDYQQCSFNRQSPIELVSEEAQVSYDIPEISFLYYDTVFPAPVTIQNNGHTANIIIPKPTNFIESLWEYYDKLSPQISGGPLPDGVFITESVHFHWGSKDTHGSEHVIDTTRFSMEMHIVHRNGKYRTVEEARENADGLAVLSIIYNVDNTKSDFDGLTDVISALHSITEYDEEATIQGFSLASLFGNMEKNEFFTYEGSLTTPPCSQAVTWVVFSNIISITHDQMAEFHELVDPHGEVLENNYRSLQAKGTRKVTLRRSNTRSLWETLKNVKPEPYGQ